MTFLLGLFLGTIITIAAAVIWPDPPILYLCSKCDKRPSYVCLDCYRDKHGH
jgi:hypothetical protein